MSAAGQRHLAEMRYMVAHRCATLAEARRGMAAQDRADIEALRNRAPVSGRELEERRRAVSNRATSNEPWMMRD